MRAMVHTYDETTHNFKIEDLQDVEPLDELQRELSAGLAMYWSTAGHILEGSGITLLDPVEGFFSIAKNFFSALFLYSYHRAAISQPRRILYVAVNQCLRGMVTGCDNLLDDEYKKTLETDLPEHGYRFRSILDIMVSDRVLFQILMESGQEHRLTREQGLSASTASLQALGRSGAQEASEENGIHEILKPNDVLKKVHHFKTGMLFQCIWAVPLAIEPIEKTAVSHLLEALYKIGIGCQILDDMVDFYGDLQQKRHNYIVSLIYHKFNPAGRSRLLELANGNLAQDDMSNALNEFPEGRLAGEQTALGYLESGLKMLLREDHRFLTAPAIEFMAKRIGADRLMTVFE
jgi:hypothetical protein